jgi:hypothetical protein
MRACATQIKPIDWHAVLRSTINRPREEELVERQFTMVPVTACDMELAFDIGRRQ